MVGRRGAVVVVDGGGDEVGEVGGVVGGESGGADGVECAGAVGEDGEGQDAVIGGGGGGGGDLFGDLDAELLGGDELADQHKKNDEQEDHVDHGGHVEGFAFEGTAA